MNSSASSTTANWGDLWDQIDAVSFHTQKGIDYLDKFGAFLKERSTIEDEYAAKLRSLAKRHLLKKKDEEDGSSSLSYVTGMQGALHELEALAGQHEVIADRLRKDLQPAIAARCAELRVERKSHLADLQALHARLNNAIEVMFKQLKAYTKAFKEAEAACTKYDKAEKNMDLSRADLEKAKANATQRAQMCDEAKQAYAHALQAANNLQHQHYTQDLPAVLERLRLMDENRISELKSAMQASVMVETGLANVIQRCYDDMLKAGAEIDGTRDSALVVEHFRTGFPLPAPYPFEDYGTPSASGSSNGAEMSVTDSATLKRPPMQGNNTRNGTGKGIPRKHSMHQRLFGGGQKGDPVDDYSNLPPQQRCRKLQAKIDQMQKEVATRLQSREGLEKMQVVYRDNPKMGNLGDVELQLGTINKEVEVLRSQLARLNAQMQDAVAHLAPSSTRPTRLNDDPSSRRIESTTAPSRPPPPHSSASSAMPKRGSYSEDSISSDGSRAKSPLRQPAGTGTSSEGGEVYQECGSPPALGTATAVYGFDGGSDGTMAIIEGEELLLIERDEGDGWTRVRRPPNHEGFVPSSYLHCKWYPD